MLHPDGTRTESVKDVTKHEITEIIYDARDVVISKKMFLLNENGDATQGVIYDGAGNPIARVQFFFDDLGRMIEERLSNMQGEVFRRVIQPYDASGQPRKQLAYNYNVKAPTMRPATIDYTGTKAAPKAVQPNGNNAATAPQQLKPGEIITASPRSGTSTKVEKPRLPFGGTK